MAVENEYSTQYAEVYINNTGKNETHETHGRLRIAHFVHEQSVAGDATSDIALAKLPAGKVRILPFLCRAYVNWTTALATLDVGWAAYTDLSGTAVAADPDGIADAIDVDAAGFVNFESATLHIATGGTVLFESEGGVDILATSTDTAIALGDDFAGYLVYVID